MVFPSADCVDDGLVPGGGPVGRLRLRSKRRVDPDAEAATVADELVAEEAWVADSSTSAAETASVRLNDLESLLAVENAVQTALRVESLKMPTVKVSLKTSS